EAAHRERLTALRDVDLALADHELRDEADVVGPAEAEAEAVEVGRRRRVGALVAMARSHEAVLPEEERDVLVREARADIELERNAIADEVSGRLRRRLVGDRTRALEEPEAEAHVTDARSDPQRVLRRVRRLRRRRVFDRRRRRTLLLRRRVVLRLLR